MIVINRISPETALVFRDVRLRALQESPAAFASTYAKECQLQDEEWVRQAARYGSDDAAAMFLAFDGEAPCGIVGSQVEQENPQCAQIISMWVAPASRHAGVGKALIDAVLQWSKSRHVSEVKLMVRSFNHDAIAFYGRMGFRMTGLAELYPEDPAMIEYEMELLLG